MKKIAILALGILSFGILLTGCSGGDTPPAPEEPKGEGSASAAPTDGSGQAAPETRQQDLK